MCFVLLYEIERRRTIGRRKGQNEGAWGSVSSTAARGGRFGDDASAVRAVRQADPRLLLPAAALARGSRGCRPDDVPQRLSRAAAGDGHRVRAGVAVQDRAERLPRAPPGL